MARIILEKQPKFFKARFLAPFSAKYRFYHELGKFPHHLQLIALDVLVSDDRKIALVKNSKAGCSTAAHVLYQYSRGHRYEGDIHQAEAGLLQGREHFREALPFLDVAETLNVTFVRHPVARAVSAYTDFFIDKKNLRTRFHIEAIREFGFTEGADDEANFSAFLHFVGASLALNREYTDRHFRPQTVNTAFGHIAYDFIGRVEHFERDMGAILRMAGASEDAIAALDMGAQNRSRRARYQPTPAQIAEIERLYAEDYEAFGY